MKKVVYNTDIFGADSIPGSVYQRQRAHAVIKDMVTQILKSWKCDPVNSALVSLLTSAVEYVVRHTRGSPLFHHINWDTQDNSLNNLLLITKSGHGYLHCHKVFNEILFQYGYGNKRINRMGSNAFNLEKSLYTDFIHQHLNEGIAANLHTYIDNDKAYARSINNLLNSQRAKNVSKSVKGNKSVCVLVNTFQRNIANFFNDSIITKDVIVAELKDGAQQYEDSKGLKVSTDSAVKAALDYIQNSVLTNSLPPDVKQGLQYLIDEVYIP